MQRVLLFSLLFSSVSTSGLFSQIKISNFGDHNLGNIIYVPRHKDWDKKIKTNKYFIRLKSYRLFPSGERKWDVANDGTSFSIVKESNYHPQYKVKTNKKSLYRLGYSKKLLSKIFSKRNLKKDKLEFMMNFWLTFSSDLKNGIRIDKTIETKKGRFRVMSAIVEKKHIIRVIQVFRPNFYNFDLHDSRFPFFIAYLGKIGFVNGVTSDQAGFLLTYIAGLKKDGYGMRNSYSTILNFRISKLTNSYTEENRNHEFLFKDQLTYKCPDKHSTETCYHTANSLPIALNAGKNKLFLMLEKFRYSTLEWKNSKWSLKGTEGVDLLIPSGCSVTGRYEYTYPPFD